VNKQEAIKEIHSVQRGGGCKLSQFPDNLKGRLAKHRWDEIDFGYGAEYGYIWALMRAFDITKEDLNNPNFKEYLNVARF